MIVSADLRLNSFALVDNRFGIAYGSDIALSVDLDALNAVGNGG